MAEIRVSRLPKAFKDIIRPIRLKGWYGGRGSAKSRTMSQHLVRIAAERKLRILCCREIQRSIRESVKYTLDSDIMGLGLNRAYVSTQKAITSSCGSQFIFEGLRSNPTAIQSLADIDIVWVEEAQSISKRSLEILEPTIRAPSSQLLFTWNPFSPKDPVDDLFRGPGAGIMPEGESLPPEYEQWMFSKKVNFDENKFFPAVLRAQMERDRARDPDKFRHVWLGEYQTRSDAAVFKNWRIGTMDVPAGARPYYGADWGFSIDPTVLVRLYVFHSVRVIYIEREVSAVGIDIDKTPAFFDTMADDEHDPLHPRKWPIRADSSRPETISFMTRHGYPKIERARKGPGSVEEGVEFLKSFDILVHPNCKRVIDELAAYSYEVDPKTEEVLPKLADADNHTIDACRYAVEEERRNPALTGFPMVVSQAVSIPGTIGRDEMNDPTKPSVPGGGTSRGVVW